ncbi:TetR/AcrR family transcriptional regulator [Prauserella cavernicola]|uniref:TetR/AcrR family transcriptional regulator C-terminal domain-containing protein n=1 Tax=Prauserella cavernicola TaxID=2800127 RepID=A0A934QNY3_9PSEU|nr:TetR/AcrR family transcriptional regulator [Prauserella cavernicola]MBK1783064.1 TetR/AcrR family transcriptional regulator C-terminal domain-containing protein [Prauserella cavernicola]
MTQDNEGPRDLTRTMRLLWRTDGAATRGPKPALDVDRIVTAAIEIADADGLAGLSMRKVADRLGVGTMSLYTYVPAKAELVSLMLDTVDGEGVLPHTVAGSWRAKTESWAREDWSFYHRHEWMLHASGRHPLGPNTMRRFDSALRSLADTGLPEDEIVANADVIDTYIRGMARRSVDFRQREASTGVSEDQWWAEHGPMLETHLTGDRFPAVRRVHDAGAFTSDIDSFEYGLQRILDGIEGRIRTLG